MNILRLSIIGLLIFLFSTCQAQNILLLKRNFGTKRVRYYVNYEIEFKTKLDRLHQGNILYISANEIFLKDTVINIADIKEVIKRRKFFRSTSSLSFTAGLIYLPVAAINNLLQNRQFLDSYDMKASGTFLGAGLLALPFSKKRYKVGKHWELSIIDLTDF